MRTALLSLVAAASLVAPTTANALVGEPRLEGPDIEPITAPVVVLDAIDDARWSCSGAMITRTIEVPVAPDGSWDRIILEVDALPDGDPWDRLLTVAIGGAEVLRGTTPRTDMTLRKDVTEYAALLPQGEEATVSISIGSFVGAIDGKVRLAFYDDEPTASLVAPAAGTVVASHYFVGTGGDGQFRDAAVEFPATAPSSATVDFTTSGHGAEEFWFQNSFLVNVPQQRALMFRTFHLEVDGVEVGAVRAMPYIYALLGFGNGNANTACVGPGTSSTGDAVHPVMWWTAQQAADRAGIHGGVGEIPQYRIEVTDPALLGLLSGSRTVRIRQENGGSVWYSSMSFLLD